MPACDARYDVTLWDGRCGGFVVGVPSGGQLPQAVLDFTEEREPDDWGDPGRLVSARLARYRYRPAVRTLAYGPFGVRDRMVLWVDGRPARPVARHRRFLRWALPADEVPPDDDPDWVTPP